MELKPRWNERTALLGIPLIEPYGIETIFNSYIIVIRSNPLIEPYGIETIWQMLYWTASAHPLIEPYGIET